MMMKNFNSKKLDDAFSGGSTKKGSTKKESTKNDEPEEIRIANFAEELKDRTNYDGMDICFVLDVTASMNPYIAGAKQSIQTIIDDAKKSLVELKAKDESLKFSIVAYRDHPPQDSSFVTKVCDFTNSDEAEKFLKELQAQGGGDQPEAVLDGIHDAIYNVNWREKSEKFMFLVLDSPPHGKQFGGYGDGFPDGCPCGYTEGKLLSALREMKVDMTVIKIDTAIDKMINIFSQYINLDVFQPKIFKQRQNMSSDKYVNAVSKDMMKNCSTKVNSKLNMYK